MTDKCQFRQRQRQQTQEQLRPLRMYTSDRLHHGTIHQQCNRKLAKEPRRDGHRLSGVRSVRWAAVEDWAVIAVPSL
jgi:hypothetical protein